MQTDPLAIRHGTLITQGWRIIAQARSAAKSGTAARPQFRRLQSLRQRITKAHHVELLRQDHPTAQVDHWFGEIEETLAKAEHFFRAQIAPQPAHLQPPSKPPTALYPM